MKSIQLTNNNSSLDISLISETLGGDLMSKGGYSSLSMSNQICQGVIKSFKVSKDISALSFDVNFNEAIEFRYADPHHESIDLFYCMDGSVLHKSNEDDESTRINFRQNTLVKRLQSTHNSIICEPNLSLKMSFICCALPDNDSLETNEFGSLREMAYVAIKKLDKTKNLKYFGRICFNTSNYLQNLLSYSSDRTSDLIFSEAAILSILASQLEKYDLEVNHEHADAPIRQYEIDQVLAIKSFLEKNLSEDLSVDNLVSLCGLAPNKLQMGFKYLFNTTVNSYVKKVRLDKAAELLETSEMNVSEIVYAIGFSSRSYFSKIFKQRFGISPSDAVRIPRIDYTA